MVFDHIKERFLSNLYIQIGGLQLEGYSFEGGRLNESKHNSPSVSTLPPCTIGWVTMDTPSPYPENECISIPVYSTSSREKLVTQLSIPCGTSNVSVIVQSGAAVFLKSF